MMTKDDNNGWIFLSHAHMINSFSCSPLNTAFLYSNKRFPEVPEYAESDIT